MKKPLIVLFICLLAFMNIPTNTASAADSFNQDSFPYKSIRVEVSPEFDQPPNWPEEDADKDHAGVIYWTRAAIVNNTDADYSGPITVNVPADYPHYTIMGVSEFTSEEASVDEGQDIEYTFDESTSTISFTPTEPIKKGATYNYAVSSIYAPMDGKDQREFNFTYEVPAKADAVSVDIYFPVGASEQKVTPDANEVQPLENGEKLYHYDYTNVEKGKQLSYDISYKKDDYVTTVDASGGGDTTEDSSGGSSHAAWWIVGIIFIVLIMLIVFLLIDRSKHRHAPMPKNTKPKLKQSSQPKQSPIAEQKKNLKREYLNGDIDEDTYMDALRALNKDE